MVPYYCMKNFHILFKGYIIFNYVDGWITVYFTSLLLMGIWIVSNLFCYKQWANKRPPMYMSLYMYSVCIFLFICVQGEITEPDHWVKG